MAMNMPMPPPRAPAAAPAAAPVGGDYVVQPRGGRFAVVESDDGHVLIDFATEAEAQAAVAALTADEAEDTKEPDEAAGAPPPAAAGPPPSWQSSLMSGMSARGRKG